VGSHVSWFEIMSRNSVALHFADPEGNVLGLSKTVTA